MKPILFNTDMVRALLDGRKTVTRRAVKIQNVTMSKTVDRACIENGVAHFSWSWADDFAGFDVKLHYRPGDILYVREAWRSWRARLYEAEIHIEFKAGGEGSVLQFQNRKDYDNFFVNWGVGTRWHPSIHMPRDAARIFLRVTDVRVERLQDITPEQAVKEGVVDPKKRPYIQYEEIGQIERYARNKLFPEIWDSTIKPKDLAIYGWDANPYVWCVSFEKISKEEAYKRA